MSRAGAAGRRRRSGETEFGGEVGSIQHKEHEQNLSAREKARIARTYGIRTAAGEQKLTGEPWPEGVANAETAAEHLNGYGPEAAE